MCPRPDLPAPDRHLDGIPVLVRDPGGSDVGAGGGTGGGTDTGAVKKVFVNNAGLTRPKTALAQPCRIARS